ncbi:32628_t:CDS:2, partial [Racocetra persica]
EVDENDDVNYIDLSDIDDPIIQDRINRQIYRLIMNQETEKIKLMELKEIEKLEIMEKKEAEKLTIIERKEELINELKRAKETIKKYESLKNVCNIRGGLEFVRSQTVTFPEPADKPLIGLSKDKAFVSFLQKICKHNNIRFDDVQTCVGGEFPYEIIPMATMSSVGK